MAVNFMAIDSAGVEAVFVAGKTDAIFYKASNEAT
jgi:hypothetical protein